MADWKFVGALTSQQQVDESSTTQYMPLGTVLKAQDKDTSTNYGEAEFVYAKGVASTVVGSLVTIDGVGHTTALASANALGQCGIAMSANAAATYYGWYCIKAEAVPVKALAAFADAKACYLTATAGSVDDVAVAGDLVHSMISVSALDTPSTGLALVGISYPYVQDV